MSLVTCLSVDVLRRLGACPASRCPAGMNQVHVLPFLQGKADQNRDDCSYKGLRRIAKLAVLETGAKPQETPPQSRKTKPKEGSGQPLQRP